MQTNKQDKASLRIRFFGILIGLYLFMFALNYKTYYDIATDEGKTNRNVHPYYYFNPEIGTELKKLKVADAWQKKSLKAVPEWIQEYVFWHAEQRKHYLYDPSNKYLIVVGYRNVELLRFLPYLLLTAFKTRRILLISIKWLDFNLEDYLVPSLPDSLDWRLPKNMDIGDVGDTWAASCSQSKFGKVCRHLWEITDDEHLVNKKKIVINTGNDIYDDLKEQYFVTKVKPNGTFREIFDIFFSPTTALSKEIRNTMRDLGIKKKKYIAAHFGEEGYHPNKGQQLPANVKKQVLHNSIDCVVHKSGRNNLPIYFTSDVAENVKYILKESPYAQKKDDNTSAVIKVVGSIEERTKYEQNKDKNKKLKTHYDPQKVLVDLWLLRMSKCVSYGSGGYGLVGARLTGGNCMIGHQKSLMLCPSALLGGS